MTGRRLSEICQFLADFFVSKENKHIHNPCVSELTITQIEDGIRVVVNTGIENIPCAIDFEHERGAPE